MQSKTSPASREKASGTVLIDQTKLVANNVKGIIVKGSGHWLMEEAPSQVIPAVVSFINDVPDTPSIQRLTPDDINALKATGPGVGTSGVSGIRTRVLAGDPTRPGKRALFSHLTERWQDLFGVRFDILLYDLTSTYFESPPPQDQNDKRRFGYSRDKRPDCVQVVVALIVTPEGFPIAYEVLPGNTADKTTLKMFLQKIETQYGRAERIWVMDRGIPTEDVLEDMRTADPPVYYLVGTPKGRLTKLERNLLSLPWQAVRPGVNVKLLPQEGELVRRKP